MPPEYGTVIRKTLLPCASWSRACVFFLTRAEELPQTPTELGDSHNKVMPLKTADAEHKTGHGKSENKSTQWGHRTCRARTHTHRRGARLE